MDFIEQIKFGFSTQSVLGLIALLSGIVYVVLASKADHRCWYFGILSCSLIAYEDFSKYALVSDGILQVVYIIMGLAGIYKWKYQMNDQPSHIKDMRMSDHFLIVVVSLVSGFVLGYIVSTWTSASLPYSDAITTTFALGATVLLIYKFRQSWIYWIIVNGAYLYIYGKSEAWFFVLLTMIYLLFSFIGWRKWKDLKEVIT